MYANAACNAYAILKMCICVRYAIHIWRVRGQRNVLRRSGAQCGRAARGATRNAVRTKAAFNLLKAQKGPHPKMILLLHNAQYEEERT